MSKLRRGFRSEPFSHTHSPKHYRRQKTRHLDNAVASNTVHHNRHIKSVIVGKMQKRKICDDFADIRRLVKVKNHLERQLVRSDTG